MPAIEQKQDEINDLLKEVVEAPIMVKDLQTNETKYGIIYAGIRDLKQDPHNFEVEPVINYCLWLNNDSQISQNHWVMIFNLDLNNNQKKKIKLFGVKILSLKWGLGIWHNPHSPL